MRHFFFFSVMGSGNVNIFCMSSGAREQDFLLVNN